jgi:hypothetical protein
MRAAGYHFGTDREAPSRSQIRLFDGGLSEHPDSRLQTACPGDGTIGALTDPMGRR